MQGPVSQWDDDDKVYMGQAKRVRTPFSSSFCFLTYLTEVKVLVLIHWPWRAVKSSTRRNSCAPSIESMASVMVVRGPYVAMPEAASSRPVMPVRREPGQMPKMVPTAKLVSMMEEPSCWGVWSGSVSSGPWSFLHAVTEGGTRHVGNAPTPKKNKKKTHQGVEGDGVALAAHGVLRGRLLGGGRGHHAGVLQILWLLMF